MRPLLAYSLSAAVMLAGMQTVVSPALAQAAPVERATRDARESAPAALLGVWRADVGASVYAGRPPQDHFRIIQYTAEARIMVSFMTLSADGQVSAGHWAIGLDGEPGAEYFLANGATPYAMIELKQRDPRTFDLINRRYGVAGATAVYRLSEDGEVLTIEREAEGGPQTRVVYRRWSER